MNCAFLTSTASNLEVNGVTSAEVIEREYPIVLERFEYVPDSAGPGRYRGSMGTERVWRFLQPASVMIRTTRLTPSGGLAGGGPAVFG